MEQLVPEALSSGDLFDAVAATGHVPAMEWLRDHQTPPAWTPSTCAAAASAGHVPMLQFLRSQADPCPWDETVCQHACKGRKLEVLQWLRDQTPQCPWDYACYMECLDHGHSPDLSSSGRRILSWMRNQQPPCPWSPDCCVAASKAGMIAVLPWLAAAPHFEWTREHCRAAAHTSRQEVLERVLAGGGLPWYSSRPFRTHSIVRMLQTALQELQQEQLQLLDLDIQNMPELCTAAASRGHLKMLQWLVFQPPQARHIQRALNAALAADQPEILDNLLSGFEGIRFPTQLDHAHCSAHCLLILAKAGCPMRQQYPHRIAEHVESWRTFVRLWLWAQAAGNHHHHHGQISTISSCRSRANMGMHDVAGRHMLVQLARLPKDTFLLIANQAFLSPEEANSLS